MLASSQGISSRTPLKPQHSNLNPNPLANQLYCIDFLTPPTPLIIPHCLLSLNLLYHSKSDARLMQDGRKAVWSIPYVSVAFFPILKQNFIAYRSSKVSSRPDCIFEIHQLWQSGFSRVYSNCCCSGSFEPEIIKIDQSSHKMYSNNIQNFQESVTIVNASTKKFETYWRHHVIPALPTLCWPHSCLLYVSCFWDHLLHPRDSLWTPRTTQKYVMPGMVLSQCTC